MSSRLATLFFCLFFALFAAAVPARLSARQDSQCDTGSISCCNSVQNADSESISGILGLLGVVLDDLTGQVGVSCSPISAIGTGSAADCTQEPVCCTGDSFNGLINLGCSPINIYL